MSGKYVTASNVTVALSTVIAMVVALRPPK
jgi:hypothetical protein